MSGSKSELRTQAKGIRPPAPSEMARIRGHLADWLGNVSAVTVLTFLPAANEVDLTPLLDADLDIRWAVTRTPDDGWLTVHRLPADLERHRYGFLQPTTGSPILDPKEIDLALLPGLAFDVRGVRLGHGSGYFDELISRCRPDTVTIGVTVIRLVMPRIPKMAHDVRVDWLATEIGIEKVDADG